MSEKFDPAKPRKPVKVKAKDGYNLPTVAIMPSVWSSITGKTWYARIGDYALADYTGEGYTPFEAITDLQEKLLAHNAERQKCNVSEMQIWE